MLTKVVKLGSSNKKETQIDLKLNDTILELSKDCHHLGVQKSSSCPRNSTVGNEMIEDRVKLGRATAFSLMGAGFHGAKGLNPIVTKAMMELYVVPRIIYGLEAQLLSKQQVTRLEDVYRRMLRQLQSLPQQVAKEAIYFLPGCLPLEATLHKRSLKLFQKIASDSTSLLHHIALRQLATKDLTSNSWFIHIVKLCSKYGLPTPHDILQQQPSDCSWKRLVDTKVRETWEKELRASAAEKSSLRFMNLEAASLKEPHMVWQAAMDNRRELDRAIIKVRLLTGCYNLHGRRVHFGDPDKLPHCKLCSAAVETRAHMITLCPALQPAREAGWPRQSLGDLPDLEAILDHTVTAAPDLNLEKASQTLCFRLHCQRIRALNAQA